MKIAILAGGLGTRISEETDTKPKPMVLIDDKPILWHLMNTFALQGFNEFVLALGYKSEVIKRWLVDLHELEGNFTVEINKQKVEKIEKLNSNDWKVTALETGLNTQTGDRGTRLSGGQRQRLGIARSMFTKPLLLILDEATSSLDGETEANITESVQKMRGEVTVVMIAHRLSTVRHADLVVYMESGKVVATGNFDEVRKLVPNFDKQAQLMGL